MIECFFFRKNPAIQLFGALHSPEANATNKNVGIVFCSPFAEEKLWSQRIFFNFASHLVLRGYAVLRFDYMGHGDSAGSFEDADIVSRLEDISCAINLLTKMTGIRKIGLFGLRLGATLATLSAEQNSGIDFLLLWEPIIQVENYLKECMRSNLAYQTAIYKTITYTRDQMVEDLMVNRSVNIDGYLLTGRFFSQAIEIDLSETDLTFSRPVQVIHISKNLKRRPPNRKIIELHNRYSQLGSKTDFQKIQAEPFWGSTKNYHQRNNELFQASDDWLESIFT